MDRNALSTRIPRPGLVYELPRDSFHSGSAMRTAVEDQAQPRGVQDSRPAQKLRILSLSSEYPNPAEPLKGLFVRARLQALAVLADVTIVSPVALLDYANPHNRILGSFRIPRRRRDLNTQVLHIRWLYPPLGGWVNAFLLFARLLWPAARLRYRPGFDLIDAHFAHPEGIAAALLSRVLGTPFMITLRGSELRYRRQQWKRYWMGWAIRRADRVIAVSQGLGDLAVELGADPARVKIIPNGIHADVFHPRDSVACRRKHEIPEGDRVILCAGDLAQLKGHHRAIQALKILADEGRPARLLIAGGTGRSGRYAAELREQVAAGGLAAHVRFLGEVAQEHLAELMCAADIFCLASSSEGWPNVVNEALACGTPVVATDVGAVRQMIPSESYGLIVPVDDAAALGAAWTSALARHWSHEAIAEWGMSRSWQQVAADVLDQARDVVAGACRR
jgi:teichuronic acid biosynthesis glycosyltransferase TuaC